MSRSLLTLLYFRRLPGSCGRMCLVLALLAVTVGAAQAQDYGWLDNPQLIVFDAKLDPETKLLRIKGEHFGLRLPEVTLDGTPLPVRSATQTYIEAGPLPRGVSPGSHVLRVVAGDDRSRFDAFSLQLAESTAAPVKPPPPPSPVGFNRLGVLDTDGDVGWSPAIAIGADGLPVVAYLDYGNLDLKVAHCADVACTSATLAVVDAEGEIGWSIGLAIGLDGLPIIAYFDSSLGVLKAARCRDPGCFRTEISVVDASGDVGKFVDIAVPPDGLPVISYYDGRHRDLLIALCRDVACSNAALRPIDTAGDVGWHNAIVVGEDSLARLSYFDANRRDLKFAICLDRGCKEAEAKAVDLGGVGMGTDLVLGADGLPLLAYWDFFNDDLKVAHCADATCSEATYSRVDTEVPSGRTPPSPSAGTVCPSSRITVIPRAT
jgi:hypothetical protein